MPLVCRLYGYAQLGVVPGSTLLETVSKEARRQITGFGPQVGTRSTGG